MHELIRAHPLATLITCGGNGLVANVLPFVVVDDHPGDFAAPSTEAGTSSERKPLGILRAHMAKANPQLDDLRAGAETLVVFQGANAYISPSWYPTKQEHGKVVPTWNYMVVQARGKPRVIDDVSFTRAQIERLTSQQESARPDPHWKVDDAPEKYIASQIRGIIGLEIVIDRLEGKWKVSQNQPEVNRNGVVQGLRTETNNVEMADAVEKRSKNAESDEE